MPGMVGVCYRVSGQDTGGEVFGMMRSDRGTR